jgi:hypothetical protein
VWKGDPTGNRGPPSQTNPTDQTYNLRFAAFSMLACAMLPLRGASLRYPRGREVRRRDEMGECSVCGAGILGREGPLRIINAGFRPGGVRAALA